MAWLLHYLHDKSIHLADLAVDSGSRLDLLVAGTDGLCQTAGGSLSVATSDRYRIASLFTVWNYRRVWCLNETTGQRV